MVVNFAIFEQKFDRPRKTRDNQNLVNLMEQFPGFTFPFDRTAAQIGNLCKRMSRLLQILRNSRQPIISDQFRTAITKKYFLTHIKLNTPIVYWFKVKQRYAIGWEKQGKKIKLKTQQMYTTIFQTIHTRI